jgi:hypothetical protein
MSSSIALTNALTYQGWLAVYDSEPWHSMDRRNAAPRGYSPSRLQRRLDLSTLVILISTLYLVSMLSLMLFVTG